jgi:PAS domain S-box-containing protein
VAVGLLDRLDEQSRLRLLAEAFERSPVAKAVATLAGELVEVNDAFCTLTGYAREDLVGRAAPWLSAPDGRGTTSERRIVRRDGTAAWLSVGMHVVHDAGGRGYVLVEAVESAGRDELRRLRAAVSVQR